MLLRGTGLFLIAYAALVGWLATRQATARAWILIVIAGNAAWTVASIALLFSVAVNPRVFGGIVVVLQAIVTGVLAELQYVGLRKKREHDHGAGCMTDHGPSDCGEPMWIYGAAPEPHARNRHSGFEIKDRKSVV